VTILLEAVEQVRQAQTNTNKPLAIIVAGHNGSGKSTMWRRDLSGALQMPLINADRLALSIYPEADGEGFLPGWAAAMRDGDPAWLRVTQQGVTSFIGHAMAAKVPFAMETVFSHEAVRANGVRETKIDLIREMQQAGYFVLLFFVGLSSADLSVLRVMTRVAQGGHGIPEQRLRERFPRTQRIIREASTIADAAIMADNSGEERQAFAVCRVQLGPRVLFDKRDELEPVPAAIRAWMDIVAPR
jgi:predicted ABC-type ATPase